ncbi:hypothetical protein PTKU64_88870 [Paraburkholderia terrae]|uniref:SMP-30/Gluconolactonase/LRE-like region domain-containing protein n=1 Tax=Paraburkholderia terrae TaxID=311230 RepID=A0ABM7UAU1_9BURK|nr:hypothetical protein PTKU64_88870 [Paraburkholderia terrae]
MFYLISPEVRTAEVFTRMPDKFRKPDAQTDWARANRGGLATDSFLEGPVWDPEGYLFVTDIPHGRVFRIATTSRSRACHRENAGQRSPGPVRPDPS